MNAAQHKLVMTLFNKLGLMPHKESIVAGFSNGKTTSTRALDHYASLQLIRWLKSQDTQEKKCLPMRNKILYYAHLLGWTKQNPQGKIVANVQRVDEWMLKYSYLKKKLHSYTYKELPILVTQFEKMYKSVAAKV